MAAGFGPVSFNQLITEWRMRIIGEKRMTWMVLAICLMAGLAQGIAGAASQAVVLVAATNAPAPVKFGVEQLRQQLGEKQLQVRVASRPSSEGIQILVGIKDDPIFAGAASTGQPAPHSPESYAISVISDHRIRVEGSDATGAMYAALDLAEQISATTGDNFVSQLKPSVKSPYLQVRGINMFLMTQDIDDPASA
ncbi:MAG: hypothetical protein ACREP9_07445, partial [Candidatus Dormibacteraceae bacterium]